MKIDCSRVANGLVPKKAVHSDPFGGTIIQPNRYRCRFITQVVLMIIFLYDRRSRVGSRSRGYHQYLQGPPTSCTRDNGCFLYKVLFPGPLFVSGIRQQK